MVSVSARAGISLEVAHLYLGELDEVAAREALTQARPWVEMVRGQASQSVSVVALVDDYFEAPRDAPSAQEACVLLERLGEESGVPLDHVVYESSMAPVAEWMLEHLIEEPRPGAGVRSLSAVPEAPNHLHNGDVPRELHTAKNTAGAGGSKGNENPLVALYEGEENTEAQTDAARLDPRHRHGLYLDHQLWFDDNQERVYSCPLLAAAWQLVRLGVLLDPPRGMRVDPSPDGRPKNSHKVRPDAPPLPALHTLSVLDSRFLEIEHAVQVILGSLRAPASLLEGLQHGPPDSPAGRPGQLARERVSYVLAAPGLIASPRSTSR